MALPLSEEVGKVVKDNMILRNTGYMEMARRIKEFNSRIVIYGAGMIGQIVVPYMIEKYCLQEYVDCFVDLDRRKQERRIKIGDEIDIEPELYQ